MDRSSASTKEYTVKLCTDQATRTHIMRFPMPGGLDVTKLENPRLERQLPVGVVQEEIAPEYGAGSEYGKKQREEARRRKRGIFRRQQSADAFPWLLRSGKKKEKMKYTGRKEGGVQQATSYYLFREVDNDTFEAVPVHSWYNFTPNISYDTLTAEEAEEQFEKRHKTLNHFAIMMQKRLQEPGERDDPGAGGSPGSDAPMGSGTSGGRNLKALMGDGLQVREDDGWVDSESGSEDSGNEGQTKAKKTKGKAGGGKGRKKKKKKQDDSGEESEQGDEESDDPDVEQSREVDYMSDGTSDEDNTGGYAADEEPKLAKKKEQDSDNQESDSASELGSSDEESEDEELTKSGRETKKLLTKDQKGSDASSDEEEEEEDYDQLATKLGASGKGSDGKTGGSKGGRDSPKVGSRTASPAPSTASGKQGKVPSKGKTKSGAAGATGDEPAAKKTKRQSLSPAAAAAAATSATASAVAAAVSSQSKTGAKDDVVTEEAVRRYLSRKPMTTKDLLKKFKGKTPMDGERLVMILGEILRKINPERVKVRDKTLLSIKA